MRDPNIKRLTRLGVLAALGVVLALFVRFPAPPPVSFLEYDMADVPIMVAAFAYGPWWALVMTVVVSVVQGITVSASSGILGIVMHILATGVAVIPLGLMYRRYRTKKHAVAALGAYILTVELMMLLCNYFLTPLYFVGPSLNYAAAQQQVVGILGYIALFNLVKPLINGLIVLLVYKPLSRLFLKTELEPMPNRPRFNRWGAWGVALAISGILIAALYLVGRYGRREAWLLRVDVELSIIGIESIAFAGPALGFSIYGLAQARKGNVDKVQPIIGITLACILIAASLVFLGVVIPD